MNTKPAAEYVAGQKLDRTTVAPLAIEQAAVDPSPLPFSTLQPHHLTAAQTGSAEAEPKAVQQACLLLNAVPQSEPLQNKCRLVYPDLSDSALPQLPALSHQCQQQLVPQLLQGPIAPLQEQPVADTAVQQQIQQSALTLQGLAKEDQARDFQAVLDTSMLSSSSSDLMPLAFGPKSSAFDIDHSSLKGSRPCSDLVSELALLSPRSCTQAEHDDAESTSAMTHLQDELLQTLHIQHHDGCMAVASVQVCICRGLQLLTKQACLGMKSMLCVLHELLQDRAVPSVCAHSTVRCVKSHCINTTAQMLNAYHITHRQHSTSSTAANSCSTNRFSLVWCTHACKRSRKQCLAKTTAPVKLQNKKKIQKWYKIL